MTFEAFQSYIKENVLKEWREDADIEMAVVRKNNGIELCGLYIRREEEQISPTIYLDEYYSYYLKGEALEEIITRIREEYEWKISRVADYHFGLICSNIPAEVFEQEGIAYGDTVKVRILQRGKEAPVFEDNVPFCRSFGYVAVGEPLLMVSETLQIQIAINCENMSEKYGVLAGSDWTMEIEK